MIAYGIEEDIGYIVFPEYGVSLDHLLSKSLSNSFSLKTVAMIGLQMVRKILSDNSKII